LDIRRCEQHGCNYDQRNGCPFCPRTWKTPAAGRPPEEEQVLLYVAGEVMLGAFCGDYWRYHGHITWESKNEPDLWCAIPPLPVQNVGT